MHCFRLHYKSGYICRPEYGIHLFEIQWILKVAIIEQWTVSLSIWTMYFMPWLRSASVAFWMNIRDYCFRWNVIFLIALKIMIHKLYNIHLQFNCHSPFIDSNSLICFIDFFLNNSFAVKHFRRVKNSWTAPSNRAGLSFIATSNSHLINYQKNTT